MLGHLKLVVVIHIHATIVYRFVLLRISDGSIKYYEHLIKQRDDRLVKIANEINTRRALIRACKNKRLV